MGIFGFNPGPPAQPQTPQMPFPMNMIQQFNNFCQSFQGDPQQQVQNMLNSGMMTQEQYNRLNNMYQQFGQFFRR